MSNREKPKLVSQLSYEDFQKYPVWTWYESDTNESLVIPVEITHEFPADEYGSLFILAELELNDGSIFKGEIDVNLSNKEVYNLVFFKGNNKFLFTGERLVSLGTLKKLSEWIQKPVEAITPIKYKTLFYFEDGSRIVGEIELRNW